MNRRTFLSNSWKNTGRPLVIIAALVLAGYGLSRLDVSGFGNFNGKALVEFCVGLFAIYWKFMLLIFSPFILALIFKRISPPAYHKAADKVAFIVLFLIFFGFIVRIEYNFYLDKQYDKMFAIVLFLVLLGTIRYFQKEKNGQK